MAESDETKPHDVPLTVLPNSGKVDQLRQEAAADSAKGDAPQSSNLISRFIDQKKTPKQKAIEEKVIDAAEELHNVKELLEEEIAERHRLERELERRSPS